MTSVYQSQVDGLVSDAAAFADAFGVGMAGGCDSGFRQILLWLDYLQTQKTGIADALLDALLSTVKESTACLVMGMARPSLFSMRTQIDLALAWLYFKDHAIEWQYVNETGDGFKLKKELFDYISTHYKGFGNRYGILKQVATRQPEDTYRFLSAHIHGQSVPVLQVVASLRDVVRPRSLCDECVQLAEAVSEYIGDVLLAVYATQWHALPGEITAQALARFETEAQRIKFMEGV